MGARAFRRNGEGKERKNEIPEDGKRVRESHQRENLSKTRTRRDGTLVAIDQSLLKYTPYVMLQLVARNATADSTG